MGTNGVFSSRLAIWKQSHGFPHWSIGTSFQAGCGGLPFNSLLGSCFPFLMLEGGPSHADPLYIRFVQIDVFSLDFAELLHGRMT